MTDSVPELTRRNQHIFAEIVKNYLESGSPVGSGLIAAHPDIDLSSASVRAIMADLEQTGLLFSPHPSAGRIPTRAGLRLFVDGLMEVGGALSEAEHASIDGLAAAQGLSVKQLLDKASMALSGLSKCASLVLAPTEDLCVTHIEFVPLQDKRMLVILVFTNGQVENRMFDLPDGLPASAMIEASNYMNAHYLGKSLSQIKNSVHQDISQRRKELDVLASGLIERGLASWSDGEGSDDASLILHGQANLLDDIKAIEDVAQLKLLFDRLEMHRHAGHLMNAVEDANGLRIFIGSDHQLFSQTGCSMVLSPYRGSDNQIIGAIGVIGPRHMNYAKIISMVDYTSETIARLLR